MIGVAAQLPGRDVDHTSLDAQATAFRTALGSVPAQSIAIVAMCNKPIDHCLVGGPAQHIARCYTGVIDVGTLTPPATPEYGYRGVITFGGLVPLDPASGAPPPLPHGVSTPDDDDRADA